MRLESVIAIMLCITGLSSAVSANSFFSNLTQQLKEKMDEASDQINKASDKINKADELAGRADAQINLTTMELEQARAQAQQSIKDAHDFVMMPGAGFTNNMDVIGLRLGMTVQEAKVTLQKHDVTMRIQEQYSQLSGVPNSKYLHQIIAISNTREQVVMEFSPPPLEPIVVRLTRTTEYDKGVRPTLINTLQALRQKYGIPTMENNKARMHMSFWFHDKTGNKMTSTAQAQHCTLASKISIDHLIVSQQQDKAMVECGASLNVQLGMTGNENDSLVGSLVATLSNPAEMLRSTQQTRAYINKNIRGQVGSVGAPKL